MGERIWTIVGLLSSLLLAACAGPGAQRGAGQFPSESTLYELGAKPPPPVQTQMGRDSLDVESWQLDGPFPEVLGFQPHQADGFMGELLAEHAKTRPGLVMMSESMHCVSRELGLFYLEHGAQAGNGLSQFIGGRCGALSPGVRSAYLSGEVPDEFETDKLQQQWLEDAKKLVASVSGTGAQEAGAFFGRRNGKAVLVAAWARRTVHIESAVLIPDAGKIHISGELLIDGERVDAMVTQGVHGFGVCEPAAGVRLPRFEVTCPVRADDEQAWLQMMATPPGRLLGKFFMEVLLRPSGEQVTTYHRPRLVQVQSSNDPEVIDDAFLVALNDVRAQAGVEPVEYARRQSVLASSLAPHYFAAASGLQSEIIADQVVLGMYAGWDVEGVIKDSRFTSAYVFNTQDVGRLLAAALRSPFGRRTLLDPEARQVAMGTMGLPAADGRAAIFSTYRFFDGESHACMRTQVIEQINARRAAVGKAPLRRIHALDAEADKVAEFVSRGELEQQEAVQRLSRVSSKALRRGVGAWYFTTQGDAQFNVPDELLQADDLEAVISVALVKTPEEPWGSLFVVIVTPRAGQRV